MARNAHVQYQGGTLALAPDPRGPVYKAREEACPFARPFDLAFRACPAYVPVVYTPEDMRGRPLQPLLTCAHSLIGRRKGERFRYFSACALGTSEDRERWAAGDQNAAS